MYYHPYYYYGLAAQQYQYQLQFAQPPLSSAVAAATNPVVHQVGFPSTVYQQQPLHLQQPQSIPVPHQDGHIKYQERKVTFS